MNYLDVRKKIKNFIKTRYEIFGELPSLYLLVAGILEKDTGKVSLYKVRKILEDWHYQKRDIQQSEELLTGSGWIIPGGGWLKLSAPSWKFWKNNKNNTDSKQWEDFVNFVLRKTDEFPNNGDPKLPWGIIRLKTQKIGRDILIYIDKGEKARVKYAIKALSQIQRYQYRTGYILHAPKNDNFVEDIKQELKEITMLDIQTIEGEVWKNDTFKSILKPIDTPRKCLDIVMTAMPRGCILKLYKYLNFPEVKCYQNWFYNKAKKYIYDKNAYVSHIEKLDTNSISGNAICFGENLSSRFTSDSFYNIIQESDKTAIGYSQQKNIEGTYSNSDYHIDNLTRNSVNAFVKESKQKLDRFNKIEPFEVDYNSVWNTYNILERYKPNTVWLSGNRVTALGIAMYWVERLQSDNHINILAPHVYSENYSEEFIPKLINVLPIGEYGYTNQ